MSVKNILKQILIGISSIVISAYTLASIFVLASKNSLKIEEIFSYEKNSEPLILLSVAIILFSLVLSSCLAEMVSDSKTEEK